MTVLKKTLNLISQCFGKSLLVSVLVGNICMMTSSNGNIFRVTGHLCGEFSGPR